MIATTAKQLVFEDDHGFRKATDDDKLDSYTGRMGTIIRMYYSAPNQRHIVTVLFSS